MLGSLSYAPRPVRRVASQVLASPRVSNLTVSNIPGPPTEMYLMGARSNGPIPSCRFPRGMAFRSG